MLLVGVVHGALDPPLEVGVFLVKDVEFFDEIFVEVIGHCRSG